MTELGRCPRCGAPTRTVALEDRKGRTVRELVLERDTHEHGNVIVAHGRGSRLRSRALEAARNGRLGLYRPHRDVCPAASADALRPTPAATLEEPDLGEEDDPWSRRRDLDL